MTVSNDEFEIVLILDEPASLERFAKLWRSRREVEAGARDPASFRFKLDVTAGEDSGRWLYSPDGFTQILSVKVVKLYRIEDAAELNEVLGIE